MIINDFIKELEQKDIEVTFSAGKLLYSGPEENITLEFIEKLKKNKGKLIKYFWPKELASVMPINTEGSKVPVFIVHGDYANYVISEHLGPEQPVYGFFHHGSEGEAIPFKSVKDMAKSYVDKMLAVYPSGPFYLMGFSFGGTLAYEMAVQLQQSGYKVPLLVLLDSWSPMAEEKVVKYSNLFLTIRKNYLGPLKRKLRDLIRLLICESYILFDKPIPLTRRADFIASIYLRLTWRYKPSKFDGNMLLFRTSENISASKYLGWETLVNKIKLVEIKGKHLEIFNNNENREIVQTEFENCLNDANGLK